jgi:hypothetical protein
MSYFRTSLKYYKINNKNSDNFELTIVTTLSQNPSNSSKFFIHVKIHE